MIKTCPMCREKFNTYTAQRIYCSVLCRNRYYNSHIRGEDNKIKREIYKPKKWRCQKCGYLNKISYDIKSKWKEWVKVKCKNCGKMNYTY